MNRRNFIRNTSLATAGALLVDGIPTWAAGLSTGTKHVVLCVVAGISKPDFTGLFPKTFRYSLANMGRMLPMRYNGQAAGHRLALESILQGRYVPEDESGKTVLTSTALFSLTAGKHENYLITANREFLKTASPTASAHAVHFCVKIHPDSLETSELKPCPQVILRNADLLSPKHTEPYERAVNQHLIDHAQGTTPCDDLLIAETACEILRQERPRLLVAHFMGADVAHADNALARENRVQIAHGLQRMWETVCNDSQLTDTLFVVVPDFGRNEKTNQIAQADGSFGTDHTIADENTKEIACMMAKPKGLPTANTAKGESIDLLPTLLRFFAPGYQVELPGKGLL